MSFRTLTIFLSILFALGACSGKKGKTGAAFSLKISSALDASIASHASGGGMVYGISAKGFKFAKKVIPSEDIILELPNDSWDFYGILWNGDADNDGNVDSSVSGVTRCALSRGVGLSGGDIDVVLNFNAANCPSVGEFKSFVPRSCKNDISSKTSYGETCDLDQSGYFSSYQFIVVPYVNIGDVNLSRVEEGFKSSCYSIASNPSNISVAKGYSDAKAISINGALANAKIPVGTGGAAPLFRVVMRSYYGSEDCGTSGAHYGSYDFDFANGIALGAPKTKVIADPVSNNVAIFNNVTNAEVCSGPRLTSAASPDHPFAFGSENSFYKGLCTARQFSYIAHNYTTENFSLLRDLNFKNTFNPINTSLPCTDIGNSIIPVGGLTDQGGLDFDRCPSAVAVSSFPFTGIFEGNNFSLINPYLETEYENNIGLFREISTNGIVRNLKIIRPHMEGASNVGIVAGVNNGLIENISIEGGKVSGRDTTGVNLGAVAGTSVGVIQNVFVNNMQLDTRGSVVGGIVGEQGGVNSLTQKTYFNGVIDVYYEFGSPVASYAGGIAGKLLASATLNESSSEGLINASGTKIGGITGHQDSASINDVYSSMILATFSSDVAKYVGGIAGFVNTGVLNNAYFSGSFKFQPCATATDCMVAEINGNVVPSGSNHYVVSDALGTDYGGYKGTSKSDIDFRNKSSFSTSFGISSLWRQIDGDYPRLSFERPRACEDSKNQESLTSQAANYGRGTSANPIIICKSSQLFSATSSLFYSLKENINLLRSNNRIATFNGTLLGEGRFIHNGVLLENSDYMNMNAFIQNNKGNLLNLSFANFNLQSTVTGHTTTGVIGLNEGVLTNVNFLDISSIGKNNVGMAIGENASNGVFNFGEVSGNFAALSQGGGVVGINQGKLQNIRAYSIMNGMPVITHSAIGAIAGVNTGIISKVIAQGNYQFEAGSVVDHFGFIAGSNSGLIEDVEVTSQASLVIDNNSTFVAGIAGENISPNGVIRRAIFKGRAPSIDSSRAITKGYLGGVSDTFYIHPASSYNQSFYITGATDGGIAGTCDITLDNTPTGVILANSVFHISIQDFSHKYGLQLINSSSGPNINASFTLDDSFNCSSLVTKNLDIVTVDVLVDKLNADLATVSTVQDLTAGAPIIFTDFQLFEADAYVAAPGWLSNAPNIYTGDLVYNNGSQWKLVTPRELERNEDYESFYSSVFDLENRFYDSTWNLVYDDPSHPDFSRIVDYYVRTELDGAILPPPGSPVWRLEKGEGGPELMLDF